MSKTGRATMRMRCIKATAENPGYQKGFEYCEPIGGWEWRLKNMAEKGQNSPFLPLEYVKAAAVEEPNVTHDKYGKDVFGKRNKYPHLLAAMEKAGLTPKDDENKNGLSAKQMKAVSMLVDGVGREKIIEKLKIKPETFDKWLKEDEFSAFLESEKSKR